jgi:hypothetical protein
MDFNLDFSLETSQERSLYIKTMVDKFPQLTQKETELCANYILYGKDEVTGFSEVDLKRVEIQSKYNSYSRKTLVSLDALMENPLFNENSLKPEQKIYKKVKPTIDRDRDKDIPGIQELWKIIDHQQKIIDFNDGKEVTLDEGEKLPQLNEKDLYQARHHLIEMRRQQYTLKDFAKPPILLQGNKGEWYNDPVNSHLSFMVLPRGVVGVKNDLKFANPRLYPSYDTCFAAKKQVDKVFDFTNPQHVVQLTLFYSELAEMVENCPDSPIWNLLWTLDFYFEQSNPSEQEKIIFRLKKERHSNKEIVDQIKRELGVTHQENYISTLWRNRICDGIVAAAELNYDEWLCRNYDKAWKTCIDCGETLFRDERIFCKKSKAKDGLVSRCKCCERKQRLLKKNKEVK